MDWKTSAPFMAVLAVLMTMWWQLDSSITARLDRMDSRLDRMDSRLDRMDSRLDRVETLLTDNLLAFSRDIGELKGTSHTHTPRTE